MDKLIELLPLYAELQGHPKLEIVKHYARACVAHAVAAQAAEIEALRAEVERLKAVAHGFVDEIADKDRRAERLAEALREAYGQVRELCDAHVHPYPEASFARYEAALLPTAAQDGK